jgi:hypothetical protein
MYVHKKNQENSRRDIVTSIINRVRTYQGEKICETCFQKNRCSVIIFEKKCETHKSK